MITVKGKQKFQIVKSVPSDISKSIRDTRNKQDTTDMVKDQVLHVKGYVKRFLNGILERLQHTDLSHGPN